MGCNFTLNGLTAKQMAFQLAHSHESIEFDKIKFYVHISDCPSCKKKVEVQQALHDDFLDGPYIPDTDGFSDFDDVDLGFLDED